jgi:hypothetical protein
MIVSFGECSGCRRREPQIHNAVWQRMIAHQLESRRSAAEPEPVAASNADPLDDPNLTDAQFLELAMAHRERSRRMPHIAFVMDYGELMTMPHIGRRPGQTDLQFLSEINAAMALSPFDRVRRSSNRRQQPRASRTQGAASAEGLTPRSIARLPTFTLPTPSPKNERKSSATNEQPEVESSEEMNSLNSTAPMPVSSQSDQESDRDDTASFESEHQARAYTSAADAVAYLIDQPASDDANDEYTLAVPTHQSVGSDISHETPDQPTEHVCMVCLEDLKGGELVRCLPCMHFFHVDCIDAWLKRKNAWCDFLRALVRSCLICSFFLSSSVFAVRFVPTPRCRLIWFEVNVRLALDEARRSNNFWFFHVNVLYFVSVQIFLVYLLFVLYIF